MRPTAPSRFLTAWLLAACLSASTSAGGQSRPTATASPPPPAAAIAQPAPLSARLLPNGLEVIVFEDHSVPIVTIDLAVRNGSFTEPPELNGFSHLYEHMFFKENQAGAQGAEYLRTIGEMGISYNGTTREEVVEYYLTTTTPNFPIALRFIRDAARYPTFDEQQFNQEREVVLGELDRSESSPYSALSREMNRRLFYRYPSRKNPAGSRATLNTATTGTMRLIQGRYYVPNNMALIFTGDISAEAAFLTAEQLFGDWPRRPRDPFSEFPLVEHPPLPQSEAVILHGPIENVVVQIGWLGPSIGKDDASTYAADVFSFILRQPDSRFQRALVDTGLASGADLGYYTQKNVGPVNFVLQTTPEKVRAAVRAAYDEIARFTDPGYFSDEELESAKVLLEASDLFSREKPSEYAHDISFWWASTSIEYFRTYLTRLRATSRADINRFVTTYIQGKPHVGLALLSENALKTAGLTTDDLIGGVPGAK